MRDDLDEMSRLEVIYKILKNQLRQHQKKLIKLKEAEKKRKEKVLALRGPRQKRKREKENWIKKKENT